MFRCSVGSHGLKISVLLVYDVGLLIYVPFVLMFSVLEVYLPEHLAQHTPTSSKMLPGLELSQERLQCGVLMALAKKMNNSSYCLPVKIIYIDLSPARGVSLGRSLEDATTLLDIDHSACA